MATLEREFYRNARAEEPTDLDVWRLIYDQKTMRRTPAGLLFKRPRVLA